MDIFKIANKLKLPNNFTFLFVGVNKKKINFMNILNTRL